MPGPGPGILTAPDAQLGPGLTFIVYNLPANAPFTLTIAGPQSTTITRNADANGVYYSYLGDQWAPGQYTFSFPWLGGAVIVSATGTKAQ